MLRQTSVPGLPPYLSLAYQFDFRRVQISEEVQSRYRAGAEQTGKALLQTIGKKINSR